MNHPHLSRFGKIAALALAGLVCCPLQSATAQGDDYETLTRGPVHEAFATTVSYDPEPGIIISTAPPEAIEEIAPDHQLEGDNVAWIPGYWAWDGEQENFLWVSGVWRNLPPSRAWIPGYWNPVGAQFQWISGYWGETRKTQVSYLPAPPRSLELGPSVAAANNDQVWLPGNWVYRENRYAWSAGYWSDPRENWVYIPGHYVWTPRGHIFVDGYWDYAIPQRGIVFAPVYFNRNVYSRPGYYYTPSTVISLSVFIDHLFLRPTYGHYYFGDYYAPGYRDRGFHASYTYYRNRRGYDPIYAYNRWSHRNDRNWESNLRRDYEYRRETVGARPPRNFADQQQRPEFRDRSRALATPLDQFVANRTEGSPRLRRIDASARERITAQNRALRTFSGERQRSEGRSRESAARPTREIRENRGPSPLANREETRPRPAQAGSTRPGRDRPETTTRPGTDRPETTTRPGTNRPETTTRPGTERPGRPGTTQPGRMERPERSTPGIPETPGRTRRPETTPGTERRERPETNRETTPPRTDPRPSRPETTPGTERPERMQPPQRTQPQPERVLPQRSQPQPERIQPPQRSQPQPERMQPPQRPQPQPERVRPPQRSQPQPERMQPQQRPQPQRFQPQRSQPQPERMQPPQRVQPPQRPQPQPQRAQPPQRQQQPPQRVQPPQQRQQPQPQRGNGGGGGNRGERRER